MKFPMRFVLKRVYKSLSKHPEKAKNNFQKYLGDKAAEIIIKQDLPEYRQPKYYDSNHYMRCGNQVILMPTAKAELKKISKLDKEELKKYYKTHPDDPKNVFSHHMPAPYLFLANRMEGY